MKQVVILMILIFASNCSHGSTKLLSAIRKQDFDQVQVLVQSGANLDIQDTGGFSALSVATYHGYTHIVKYLCENGANVDLQDNNGFTALMYAADFNHEEIVRILISHKASLDIVNKQGRNAFSYAKQNHYKNIIKIFKEAYF